MWLALAIAAAACGPSTPPHVVPLSGQHPQVAAADGSGPAGDVDSNPDIDTGTAGRADRTDRARAADAADSASAASDPDSTGVAALAAPARTAPWRCTSKPFASPLPVAEASGAVYLAAAGRAPVVLVVGDSGNRGQYVELDAVTGEVVAAGHLPLGSGASDDLEGLTALGDTIYALTSAGSVRRWQRHPARVGEHRYTLTDGPYPLAPRSARGVSESAALVCDSPRHSNCARNYEGLCLHPRATPGAGVGTGAGPGGSCVGFAVSKTDGALYCLALDARGRLAIRRDRDGRALDTLPVAMGETLTGCHFGAASAEATGGGEHGDAAGGAGADPAAALWVGSNWFGVNRVFAITGWQRPATARIDTVGTLGSGFGEAIAVGPGPTIFRFSDHANARSLAAAYLCE